MKENILMVKEKVFRELIRQLRSVEIDGENLFVVEGDLLMTEAELHQVSVKQLRFYVQCQQAFDASRQRLEETSEDPPPQ
jgi:hypothetical protein